MQGNEHIVPGYVIIYQQSQGRKGNTYNRYVQVTLPFNNFPDITLYPPRVNCAVTFMEFDYANKYLGMLH